MIRKILAALDGTSASEAILPYLDLLLASEDSNLSLVRVIPSASPERKQEAMAYLSRAADKLRDKGAVVDVHVLTGKPAGAIVDLAVRGGYALIVMASRGRSGMKKLILGSVAEEVLHQSPVPVLAVHPATAKGDAPSLKRIIVPLDGSHRSGSILPHVTALAKVTGAKVLLMTIVQPNRKPEVPVDVLARTLFREQSEMHQLGISTELVIRYGDPTEEILAIGEVEHADLVALSTHGRSGLERALYGSVAESILREGRFPMLILRTAGIFVPDPIHAPEIRAGRRAKRLETVKAP